MCERRVLIVALVTDIHDTAVTYPCCTRCYSKLLVDPTTDRYHCIRCGVSCDRRSVQWRYRLVLSIADGNTIGKVVVFGKTLDGFFGKTATDFSRSLGDLEQTGYPASSMLAEALLRTFHGKYFYFGFKVTGSSELEESYSLKDVLKLENSQCYSQLDCTSNFENFHTLAYQMLACSDAVFASVTDHMRLFVKHLRNHNQSKPIQTPEQNPSLRNQNETQSLKKISINRTNNNSSLFYNTVSFGEDIDSLRFSFETSENKSCSLQESKRRSACRNQSNESSNLYGNNKKSENDGSISSSLIDMKEKESFLASETAIDDLPRCVTFDTVNGDGESCFPSVAVWSRSCSILKSKIKDCVQNGSSMPSVSSLNHETFQRDISVAQRLNFDDLNESNASITSKKIDEELIRRKYFTSQKSAANNTSHTRSVFGLTDTTNQNNFEPRQRYTEVDDLSKYTAENDLHSEEELIENEFEQCSDNVDDVSVKRLPEGKMVDELRMPESEDLNAFFESQFEGIEFSQDIVSEEQGSLVHNGDNGINYINIEADEVKNKVNDEGKDIENSTVKQYSVNNTMDKVNSKHGTSTESTDLEEYEDFNDSFEECQVEMKEPSAHSIVNVSAENIQSSTEKLSVLGEWNELKTGVDVKENLDTHEITNSKLISEEKIRSELDKVSLVINEEMSGIFEGNMTEDNEKIENSLKSNKQGFCPVLCDSGSYDKEVKAKEKFSDLFVRNNFLNISNLNTEEPEVNELYVKDNSTNEVAGDQNVNSSNESSDLDQFFADISNESSNLIVGSIDKNVQENSFARSKQKKSEVNTGNEKTNDDFESDLEDFLHDLSQLSLIGSNNSSLKKSKKARDANIPSKTNYDCKSTLVNKVKDNDNELQDILIDKSHENDISNSFIDFSTDNEGRKLRISIVKPSCGFTNVFNAMHKVQKPTEVDVNNQEIKTNSVDIGVTNSETVLRSTCNSVENVKKLQMNADTGNRIKFARVNKDTSYNLETLKELEKGKDSNDVSSCIDYSADLFEMSGGGYEQNSLCVLTVSTPSFNTNSNLKNTSLNENLFEESPMGTSTPGLDECVILESQYLSCIFDSQRDKESEKAVKGKRRVTFDKRLRRVSTCHVMDIRMRLNESPLMTPVIAGKPCIKNMLKISPNNVPEISVLQNQLSNVCEKTKLDTFNSFDAKQIVDKLGNSIETDTIGRENSGCLDGSTDLFGGSFILSARTPVHTINHVPSYPENSGTIDRETVSVEQVDGVNVNEDGEAMKDDEDRHLVEDYPNSQDLWLNESTDSFIQDALQVDIHIKSGEKSVNVETRNRHGSINGYKKNNNILQKDNQEQAITPDLFASPCENDRLPIKVNGDRSKIQYFSLKGFKTNNTGYIGKSNERKALECLVINTPDCVSVSVSKQKPMLMKFENCSKDNRVIPDDMKENINVDTSPDIFEDSIAKECINIDCDRNTADFAKSSVLCKKLFF